jgi:AcrR family transcriptional regulator
MAGNILRPMDRRERKKQRTRLAIQDAAFELFAERGYRDTTIDAIADRADVAPRTVTVHFPTKDALLFDVEPFSLEGLVTALESRAQGESALDALQTWMAGTMVALDSAEASGRFWERRALRAHIIDAEPELRGRARAGNHEFERVLADAIGQDIGQSGSAIGPRLAALTTVTGLRELYETDEARALGSPPSAVDLLALVDRVIAFARAGLEGR